MGLTICLMHDSTYFSHPKISKQLRAYARNIAILDLNLRHR